MADYHYCKLNLEHALLDAMENGTLRDQCIMIMLNVMNEKNVVKPRLDPQKKKRATLVQAIAELTKRDDRRIQEQLRELNDQGFGKWNKKKNIFTVHKRYARKGNSKYQPEYDGVNPQFAESGVLCQLMILFDTPYAAIERKHNMNKAMLKKMDNMEQALQEMCSLMRMILQKPNDAETREKVERHLKLVENDD